MQKNKTWRLGILTAAMALMAAIAGCEQTKISDINKNPEKYAGDEVTIVGKVTSTASPTNPGTFEVDDGSGRLWVLSSSLSVPPRGARVAVTGLVESATSLGSTSLPTALQEIRRSEAD
jgi:hypothetical protein